ncbi:MAG: haloacid dehalogenase-like hydrolase [Candidatus Riflebacteria bacterium]|nr:haloacid dehalogenase-like hydrolase [Candidatus Riflebacteria bacterium]
MLNESPTISTVVDLARRSGGVTEVIVVDDGSIDGTPELAKSAGARVILSTLLGKGASMEDGLWAAQNDLVLYLDGDLSGLSEDLVETMLTARPLILAFFPALGHIEQPLGGIVAARRSVLRNLRFETDYGVDVGLLLDVAASGATMAQADIGHVEHDSQSIQALGDMAKQVVRVILDRASRYGRLDLEQIREVEEVERRSLAEFSVLVRRVGQPQKLALFDMDGTLLRGRFVVTLAGRVNKSGELAEFLDSPKLAADERTRQIAGLFAGVPRTVFEEAARSVPLNPGAAEVVVALRKIGYRVGIVTDSFLVAAEIVRRRVFADFSVAHVMRFKRGIATGSVTICKAMQHDDGCHTHNLCKLNVLRHLCDQLGMPPELVLAVGDSDPDACMLRAAGLSVAFQPKSKSLADAANHVVQGNLLEILGHLESSFQRADLPERRLKPR